MTKLLNLNQLNPKEGREVQIGEKTYKVREMSVEDFIETTKVAEKMETETSYANQLSETMNLIKRSIPDIEGSVLMGLSLEQLRALTSFIRGTDPATIMAAHESLETETAEGNA
jgi:phage FluMu protein gp41